MNVGRVYSGGGSGKEALREVEERYVWPPPTPERARCSTRSARVQLSAAAAAGPPGNLAILATRAIGDRHAEAHR